MSESNDCTICCESLTTAPFGVCSPCGHCFHHECYDGWASHCIANRARTKGRRSSRVPCPNCNSPTDSFVQKVFLNLSHDSGSEGRGGDDESVATKRQEEPIRSDDKASEWKLTAAKKGAALLLVQEQHRELLSRMEETNAEVSRLQRKCDVLSNELAEERLELSDVRVRKERAERQRDEAESKKRELTAELRRQHVYTEELSASLRRAEACYQSKIENFESEGMAEIEAMLSQHEALKQENHTLRAHLAILTKEAKGLRSLVGTTTQVAAMPKDGDANRPAPKKAATSSQLLTKRALLLAKEMSKVRVEEDRHQRGGGGPPIKRRRREEGALCSGGEHSDSSATSTTITKNQHLSANSARIVRAVTKNKSGQSSKTPSTALAALARAATATTITRTSTSCAAAAGVAAARASRCRRLAAARSDHVGNVPLLDRAHLHRGLTRGIIEESNEIDDHGPLRFKSPFLANMHDTELIHGGNGRDSVGQSESVASYFGESFGNLASFGRDSRVSKLEVSSGSVLVASVDRSWATNRNHIDPIGLASRKRPANDIRAMFEKPAS